MQRREWVELLVQIAGPVFKALAAGELKAKMPVEAHPEAQGRDKVTHLEAVGRSLAGIAPWLALPPEALENETERTQQAELLALVHAGLAHVVDPASPDRLNFSDGGQPVVDAAFLVHGLLRGGERVWGGLATETQTRLLDCLRESRAITPHFSNWLLFSAMVEAGLHHYGAEDWDGMRVDYAVRQHEQWYLGDGAYGDGPHFHWDYYNSFVIQPMLHDILLECGSEHPGWKTIAEQVPRRLQRFAAVQERMISPEGSFPPIGRSLAYRFGAFQALAHAALHGLLPDEVKPAAVRCGLGAVIARMRDGGMFDDDGWLTIGFCGHQPAIGERYISTGSTYLCCVGLLPLGLAADDPFWNDPDAPWTARQAWSGLDVAADHALR